MRTAKDRLKKFAYGGDPTTKPRPATLTSDQLTDFSNFSGDPSRSVTSLNNTLGNYGLKGIEYLNQPYAQDPTKGGDAVTKSQQDWVASATGRAMMKARSMGVDPSAFLTNAKTIYGDNPYSDTIFNNKDFARMYPNYLDVANRIYKDRYNNYVPKVQNDIASTTPKPTMAMGGDTMNGILESAPQLLSLITQLTNGNTSNYSRQPIVNASTMKNMASPYTSMAFGGTIEDLDENERQQLQNYADENGIDIQQALEQVNQQRENSNQQDQDQDQDGDQQQDDDNDSMAYGGRMRTNNKWKLAFGGNPSSNVEVEGGEAIQTPDGQVGEVKGPSHEQGGVDMNLPEGTQVFSNRLKVEGKSMKARKLARAKRLEDIQKLLAKNPNDMLLRNTSSRTIANINNEDNQDMSLQKVASQIYAPPTEAKQGGSQGMVGDSKKFAYGDEVDDNPFSRFANNANGIPNPNLTRIPMSDNYTGIPVDTNYPVMTSSTGNINPNVATPSFNGRNTSNTNSNNPALMGSRMTTGDYVGMAGTLFNSVAPIINTMNNRRATLPNINRFKGFGHDAITANDTAQDYVANSEGNDLSDIDTSVNGSYARNNGASSVNTSRALNIATDIMANKARASVRGNYSKAMAGLLGQRGQLTNIRDFREDLGQSQVDTENKADTDNYYSNMGANLGNLGTGVQTIGRDLNISHGNKVDANLISQLSRYGLEFDEQGNLITKHN